MSDDAVKIALLNVINAIEEHRKWIGTTTRELRDKVEGTGVQIQVLSKHIEATSFRHKDVMEALIDALNKNSKSSDRWASMMVLLTVVLAFATAVAAFGAIYPIISHKP